MLSSKHTWGGLLILLASMLGTACAARDYVTSSTGIDHSSGVRLVLASNLLMMLGAALVLTSRSKLITNIFMFAILFDVLGTGFAAYMLESGLIMAAMVMAAVGWFLRIASAKES